jgi:hypothetical protein
LFTIAKAITVRKGMKVTANQARQSPYRNLSEVLG